MFAASKSSDWQPEEIARRAPGFVCVCGGDFRRTDRVSLRHPGYYRMSSKRETHVKIYTRTGDQGETGLLGGVRVKKHEPRIEAYGTVDELNAMLGVVRSVHPSQRVDQILEHIQNELFIVGAELATPAPKEVHSGRIEVTHIGRLEEM